MTVEELIAHLSGGPQHAEVVVVGHFGEHIHLSEEDFSFRHYKPHTSPRGQMGDYLEVTPVDIGPEPE